jgi:hypothetical protein
MRPVTCRHLSGRTRKQGRQPRTRLRRRARGPHDRCRMGAHASDTFGIPRPRPCQAVLCNSRIPAWSPIPTSFHPRQRATRLRRVCARHGHRGRARKRSVGHHRRWRENERPSRFDSAAFRGLDCPVCSANECCPATPVGPASSRVSLRYHAGCDATPCTNDWRRGRMAGR